MLRLERGEMSARDVTDDGFKPGMESGQLRVALVRSVAHRTGIPLASGNSTPYRPMMAATRVTRKRPGLRRGRHVVFDIEYF